MKYRAYEIAINPKYDGYQRGLGSMVYKFFGENVFGFRATKKVGADVNEVLAQELHKPVIKKFKRREVYARFQDNIWAADSAETGS